MRPRLVHLFCAGALLLPAAMARAQLSERMRAQIRETLPKYSPQPAETKPAESSIGTPAPLSDEPVVRLPDFVVAERNSPSNDPDSWLGKQALQKKALREYKNSLNPLEWALACFYIPFLTPSLQDQADAAYQQKKTAAEARKISNLIDAVSQIDPVAAKKLARDADLSRHPGD